MKEDDILNGIDRYYEPDNFHHPKETIDMGAVIINGVSHTIMNCSVEEYLQITGAKLMEDICWK